MKNSLFIAAVVLFCTQVIDAIPCTTSNNGGTRTVTTTHTFTPATYTTSFNSGNKFATNGGRTLTNFQTSSSNSDFEAFKNPFNLGQNGETVTVTNYSASGKGGNDDDSRNKKIETLQSHFNFGKFGKGGNDNDNNGQRGKGDNNNSWHAVWNYANNNGGGGSNQGNGNNKGKDDCAGEKAKNLIQQREIEKLNQLLSQQQNEINQLNVQLNTINSKNTQTNIEVKELRQTNINLKFEIQQSQTTIINLKNNIQQMTKVTQDNEKALIELTHKNNILTVELENFQKNTAELTRINTNFQKDIQKINISLKQCQSSNSELSAKYLTLQQSSQTVQLNFSNCEHEKKNLQQALNIQFNKFDEDEKDDLYKAMLHEKTKSYLKECKEELSTLQELYTIGQANLEKCKNQVTSIKIELETITINFETTINNLTISINKLEVKLQAEVDIKNTYILKNKKCESNNIDLTKKLELTTQAVSDAESRLANCNGDLDIYITKYQTLEITLENKIQEVSKCGSVTSTIQLGLATCEAKLGNCSNELNDVKDSLTEFENENIQLGNQNLWLKDSLQQCEDKHSALQCKANKGLGKIEESQNALGPIIQRIFDSIDDITATREKFSEEHDTPCLES
ncbi:hypothetical protein HA402_005451 [Bradysia odoriphaga]|nr:hypothetical protein HA402_005451 [Bradysia odoriphaga]